MTWDQQWTDEKTVSKWLKPGRKIVVLSRELKAKGFKRALDSGCGVGRHVVFLAREGWEAYGSDFSEPGVKRCREWLEKEGLTATVWQADMTSIEYPDGFFDFIIANNTIYHTTFAGMQELVELFRRKLLAGGY